MPIVCRFGGGAKGGAEVDVQAYPSYSDLPLVGKENELAIIAESIGFLTMDSIAPLSPAEGDVWVRISGSDLHKVTLIDSKSQNVTVSIQGVYIYSSGLWVLADAYLWDGTQWSSIPTIFFYGTDRCPSVTGGWALYSGYTGMGANTVVDYDNYIKIDGVGCTASAAGTYHTVNKIDLAPFTTLYVSLDLISVGGKTGAIYFYVGDSYTTPMYNTFPQKKIGSGYNEMRTFSIDVSAETGSKYISIGCYGAGGNGYATWVMDKVWGV